MIRDNICPIFIVGAPRSGTTLLAAMLAAHSRLSCGPETRFFHFLARSDPDWLCDSWPDNAVEFLFTIRLIEPIPGHYELTREQLHSYLAQRTASVPVILAALTEQFMWRENKERWVEKSPENLRHVDDIRRYFPGSPIVRIIRDPRDTALSMVKWPNGPQSFDEALLYWRKYDEQSADFFQADDLGYTLYYEKLVQSPAQELRQLCHFIDESYEPAMMDTTKSADRVVTKTESWKSLAHKPVDKNRIDVWKRELSLEERRLAEALIGDRLQVYGYELSGSLDTSASVYPSIDALLKYPESMMSFVEEGIRFWQVAPEKNGRALIYIGEPDKDKWLSNKNPGRWWDTLRIITRVLKGRLAHRPIYWVRDQNKSTNLGQCGRLLSFVFQRVAVQGTR